MAAQALSTRVPWASLPCRPQVFTPAPLRMKTQVGAGRPQRPTSSPTQAHARAASGLSPPWRPPGLVRASSARVGRQRKAARPLTSPLQAPWAPRGPPTWLKRLHVRTPGRRLRQGRGPRQQIAPGDGARQPISARGARLPAPCTARARSLPLVRPLCSVAC